MDMEGMTIKREDPISPAVLLTSTMNRHTPHRDIRMPDHRHPRPSQDLRIHHRRHPSTRRLDLIRPTTDPEAVRQSILVVAIPHLTTLLTMAYRGRHLFLSRRHPHTSMDHDHSLLQQVFFATPLHQDTTPLNSHPSSQWNTNDTSPLITLTVLSFLLNVIPPPQAHQYTNNSNPCVNQTNISAAGSWNSNS